MDNEQKTKQSFWSRRAICPRWWEFILAGIWLLAVAWFSSNVVIDISPLLGLGLGGLILAGLWLLRLFILIVRGIAGCHDSKRTRRQWIAWCIVPMMGLLGVVLIYTQITLQLRFSLSENALTKYVQRVPSQQEKESWSSGKWVGLYQVRETERVGDCVRFATTSACMDTAGFAYFPQGIPPKDGEDYYRHFRGPWWIWYQSW